MLVLEGVDVDAHGVTDRGRVRRSNEDQFLVAALHKVVEIHGTSIPEAYQHRFDSQARALILLVADGVGGRPGGDAASSLTLDAIVSYVTTSMRCFYKLDEQIPTDLLDELAQVVRESHDRLRSHAMGVPDHEGMATTLTMAHVLWPRVYIVQIGDSRCYHLREGRLLQVTRDQTVVQDLVDRGALDPDDAANSPFSSMLLQAIGGDSDINPVITRVDMRAGDTLLLCTDGLTKHVADEEMRTVLLDTPTAEGACRELRDTALTRGGTDNVTVVVSRFR